MEAVPAEAALIVGDCIQNIRAALDHLAWQLVCAVGNSPTDKTAFPLFGSRFNDKGNPRNISIDGGVDPKALALIKWYQPYRRGAVNDLLGFLRELSNIDKHRTILLMGISYDAVAFTSEYAASWTFRVTGPIPLKEDTRVGGINYPWPDDPHAEVDVNVELAPMITFGKGEACESEVVSNLLQRLLDAVEGVVVPSFQRRFF